MLVHRPTIHARTPPQPSTTHARTPPQPCTNHARTPPQTYIAHARTPPVLVHLPTKFLIFMLVHLPHYNQLFTVVRSELKPRRTALIHKVFSFSYCI